MPMITFNSLEEVAQRVRSCTDCGLCKQRTHAVPGEGPGSVRIMFIGEAPGYYEDQQERPFVGPAGKFLEQLLSSVGIKREEVFITNMVKCRPPNNREPLPAEIQTCSKYLDRQIELLNPKVIVTLGRYSFAKFCPNEPISKARGKPRKHKGLVIFPMLHPAAALHRQDLRKVIEDDIKLLPSLLKQVQETPQQPYSPPPKQMSMF